MSEPIVLYVSTFCAHSRSVRRFLQEHNVPVQLINIDEDPAARETLITLNKGYASVPTLVFPDGSQLTEPTFQQLRGKLGIEKPGLLGQIRTILGL